MECYQIVELTRSSNDAGTKATADIAAIADRMGFKRIAVRMDTTKDSYFAKIQRQVGYFRDWGKAKTDIPEGAILLLQHPFHHNQLTREKALRFLKKQRHVKVISVVHDVEALRVYRDSSYYAREFGVMLDIADVIIVHNKVMRDWFIHSGVNEKKLVTLGIFDYLRPNDAVSAVELPAFRKSISIAGNLDSEKSKYIARLGELSPIQVNLYGSNFNEALLNSGNIVYRGSFPPNQISQQLTEGFGLVWDGDGLEGCTGGSGQYLKYNNPHKLSLYLASGMPVIIWKSAAEAEFVSQNKAGICVSDLRELSDRFQNMDEEDYRRMAENAEHLGKRLRSGYYGKRALENALEALKR